MPTRIAEGSQASGSLRFRRAIPTSLGAVCRGASSRFRSRIGASVALAAAALALLGAGPAGAAERPDPPTARAFERATAELLDRPGYRSFDPDRYLRRAGGVPPESVPGDSTPG